MAHWRRLRFPISCFDGERVVIGWVMDGVPECWGVHGGYRDWMLTHLPTGASIPAPFATLRDAKRFAEVASERVKCGVGKFGKSLKGVRGGRAFVDTLRNMRDEFGFKPIVPVTIPGTVVYGPRSASEAE
jgi:hypothetical protein